MPKVLILLLMGSLYLPNAQANEPVIVFENAEGFGGDEFIRDYFVINTKNLGTVTIETDGSFREINYALPNIDQDCGLSSVQYLETHSKGTTELQLSYEINCYDTGYSAYAEMAVSDHGVLQKAAMSIGGFNSGPTVQHGSLVFLTAIGSISIYDRSAYSVIYSRSDLYSRYQANIFGVLTFDSQKKCL